MFRVLIDVVAIPINGNHFIIGRNRIRIFLLKLCFEHDPAEPTWPNKLVHLCCVRFPGAEPLPGMPEKLIIVIGEHLAFLEIPMKDISPIIDFQ
jgi:hypothetical protein